MMRQLKYDKELYSKVALLKAAYNFTDQAYIHLDSDESYYYVSIEFKTEKASFDEQQFTNEILAQSVRHEIYKETKNIRELLLARAMATSVLVDKEIGHIDISDTSDTFQEDEILKDWFDKDE